MFLRVHNNTRQTLLADRAHIAASMWSRMVGLLGKSSLEPGDGLLLRGEQMIHMFFMHFPIDVVYLDRQGRVLRTVDRIAPWRVGPLVWNARDILELPAGTLSATGTRVGDELVLETMTQ